MFTSLWSLDSLDESPNVSDDGESSSAHGEVHEKLQLQQIQSSKPAVSSRSLMFETHNKRKQSHGGKSTTKASKAKASGGRGGEKETSAKKKPSKPKASGGRGGEKETSAKTNPSNPKASGRRGNGKKTSGKTNSVPAPLITCVHPCHHSALLIDTVVIIDGS